MSWSLIESFFVFFFLFSPVSVWHYSLLSILPFIAPVHHLLLVFLLLTITHPDVKRK